MNKTPPESILLPITTHLPHFLNKVIMCSLERGTPNGPPEAAEAPGEGCRHLVGNPWQDAAYAKEGSKGLICRKYHLNFHIKYNCYRMTSLMRRRCTTTGWPSRRGRSGTAASVCQTTMSRTTSSSTQGSSSELKNYNMNYSLGISTSKT